MSPRCFCFQPLFPDCVCDITKFGTVVAIFPEHRPSVFDHRIEHIMDKFLEDSKYDPEIDYIVIVKGNLAGTVRIVSAVTSIYGKCKALMYDVSHSCYVATELGFELEESEVV